MATNKARFSITLDDDLLDEIESYQKQNQIVSRSKAIVSLIEKGVDSLAEGNLINQPTSLRLLIKEYSAAEDWKKKSVEKILNIE